MTIPRRRSRAPWCPSGGDEVFPPTGLVAITPEPHRRPEHPDHDLILTAEPETREDAVGVADRLPQWIRSGHHGRVDLAKLDGDFDPFQNVGSTFIDAQLAAAFFPRYSSPSSTSGANSMETNPELVTVASGPQAGRPQESSRVTRIRRAPTNFGHNGFVDSGCRGAPPESGIVDGGGTGILVELLN